MIKKLTILALSVILTVPIVAAAAPEVTLKKPTLEQQIAGMTNACRQGYVNYRYGGVDAKETLQQVLRMYPDNNQKGMAGLICIGYGEGYEDGRRGVS